MNILEQLKQAKARRAETQYGVVTFQLEIGQSFEFGTIDELRVGDMVPICEGRRFEPIYGNATITKDLGGGFYEAERIH